MQFPQRFSALPDYAFTRLRRLLDGHKPGGPEIAMAIGEPRHTLPHFVAEIVALHAHEFSAYPPDDGSEELRAAIAGWIARRYGVRVDPDREVIALNGMREGLFAAPLALSPETKAGGRPLVLMPNPFFQAYGAAALAAGAEPVAVAATAANGFLPDYAGLSPRLLDRVSLVYVCSPSNPEGAVADESYWRELIGLAERHDFVVLADECYAEIHRGDAPAGALAAARAMGADSERVVIFHSLSKRSGAPGLRSGFAAGGAGAIAALRRLRAYGGAPLPLPLQRAAAALWRDEAHVEAGRALYAAKLARADAALRGLPGYAAPQAGFFLWLEVGDGEAAALRLWREAGVRALPGAYLGRDTPRHANPGRAYLRVALVPDLRETARGLDAIAEVLQPQLLERV